VYIGGGAVVLIIVIVLIVFLVSDEFLMEVTAQLSKPVLGLEL